MALLAFQNHKWRASSVSAHPTLTTSLVSYWDLDEASGNRADSHGSNTLDDNNTVTSTTGIGGSGTAALFTSANSEFLSITDAAQSGLELTGSHSYNVWFNPSASTGTRTLMGKWGNSGQATSKVLIDSNNTRMLVLLSDNGSFQSGNVKTHTLGAALATSTWHMLTWVYNQSAGTVRFSLNGSFLSEATGLTTSPLFDGNAAFRLGAGDGEEYIDGAGQFAGVWSKVLTTQEITDLYNAGAGLPY